MRTSNSLALFLLACLLLTTAPIRANGQAATAGNASQPDSTAAADLVIKNAAVRTMDAARPFAEAVAVKGRIITAIGSAAEVGRLVGPQTRLIDARGALLLPGFNDAHVHFLGGGFQLSAVDLRDAATPQEFAERIRRFAAKLPRGRWVTGGDWDHERWPGAPLPTRELIDRFTPETPVFVDRLDGHMALANSLALKLVGVTRETKDPPGGLIVRDPKTGEPTGVLKDAAMNFVLQKIPPATFEEKLAAARAATDYAASLGVTSVQDVSAGDDVGVYQTLLEQGGLKTRIYAVTPLPAWERLARVGVRRAFGSDMLRIGGLKGFADGSLGSTTALFFDPYLDAPDTRGLPGDEMFPEGAMLARAKGADAAGLQVMIHAIGDRANDQILALFAQVEAENGRRDRRFRIEHAQHLRPEEVKEFAVQRVVASMQPYHAIDDGRWAEKRIGPARAKGTYAFRSLIDAGATLAFGSDWTVAPLDPIQGIYAAVTRRTLDGRNPTGWVPEQKITVEEAVRAYTAGSAYAEFADAVKGTITPGKLADLVLLDRDIFRIEPAEIERARVTLTIVDGRVVYDRTANGGSTQQTARQFFAAQSQAAQPAQASSSSPPGAQVSSPRLQSIVDEAVRAALDKFKEKGLAEKHLAVTLVDLTEPGRLELAGFRGAEPIYPASVVKLFYLAAAHRWLEDGRLKESDELTRAMRDMIVDSSNDATHYIVDALTGVANGALLEAEEMRRWAEQRNAVNRYFASLGYEVGPGKNNINQKPWCEGPYGRERVFLGPNYENRNKLTTNAVARLVAEIATGRAVSPARSARMLELMKRNFTGKSDDPDDQAHGFTGIALEPGMRYWSKAGWTSTTRHDAAYIELPNGRKLVLVTFTTDYARERDIIPTVARAVIARLSKQ
jgi:predicted amidohydrolase YtcJ/beta-lactamase class A